MFMIELCFVPENSSSKISHPLHSEFFYLAYAHTRKVKRNALVNFIFVNYNNSFYLIVPVGDGQGLSKVRSTLSGMFIFRGGEIFFLGGVSICKGGGNAAAGVVSSTSDWNAILIAVLGNRKVHL